MESAAQPDAIETDNKAHSTVEDFTRAPRVNLNTAYGLLELGAVNGLTVYVPPAYTRRGLATLLDPHAAQKLHEAEVVLGVVGA